MRWDGVASNFGKIGTLCMPRMQNNPLLRVEFGDGGLELLDSFIELGVA
jgi:hypothetical protein